MALDRKFYKTTVSIDVLSEEPLGEISLADLDYAITEGPCVGYNMSTTETELTPKQVADALNAAGSEPGFFMLDADGNSTESDDAE